ncbi:MAG: hypothetical protein AB4372_20120 [Xenococcus sp. (in: cyanobacteria)]|nr:hypothetical protein [Xenococcaceae cyanobacterium MO_167.B52]
MPRSDHYFYLTIANSKARQLRTLFAIAKMRIAVLGHIFDFMANKRPRIDQIEPYAFKTHRDEPLTTA